MAAPDGMDEAMTITFSMLPESHADRDDGMRARSGQPGSDPTPLEPLLAGARARGMSDAFDMMGLAFVMIDGNGMILHVSSQARAVMGPHLAVASEHLVGAGQGETRAIQSLIGSVLQDGASPGRITLPRGQGGRPLVLRGLPVPSQANDRTSF